MSYIPSIDFFRNYYNMFPMVMILNGLGFIDDRLYMFPKFLENKPVAKLFGANVKASDFNDDALGRFLDEVHAYGETKLYSEIALPIALGHKLLNKSAHFDTTSLSLYGDYDTGIVDTPITTERTLELPKNVQPHYGHAKNKRVDLKQMTKCGKLADTNKEASAELICTLALRNGRCVCLMEAW